MARRIYKTGLRDRWRNLRNKWMFHPQHTQLEVARALLAKASMDELHDVYQDETQLGVAASEELARRKRSTIDPSVEVTSD